MPTEYYIHATMHTPLVEKSLACLRRIVGERTGIAVVDAPIEEAALVLDVQPGIGAEGFRIEEGADGRITIAGDCERGLLYGVGKLLHDASYDAGQFTPGCWRGVSVPQCPLRGIYFALHGNFYSHASLDELERYMEELALWGINTLAFHLPLPVDGASPEARAMHARNHELLRRARNIGMRLALLNSINCGLADAPKEALAPEFPILPRHAVGSPMSGCAPVIRSGSRISRTSWRAISMAFRTSASIMRWPSPMIPAVADVRTAGPGARAGI